MTAMAEFCIHEKHGGICGKTGTYCNLGACPDEDLKEYAPVRPGRWVQQPLNGTHIWRCSKCETLGSPQWNYCPKCGVRMDEEAKHERSGKADLFDYRCKED